MTVDKLLVDYIIGDLEFDGLYTYCFIMYIKVLHCMIYNYVMEYIQAYNMQNRYHIARVTYQQPLTSQKVKIYSTTLFETTTVPIKKKNLSFLFFIVTKRSLLLVI